MKKALITGGAKRLGESITLWLAKNNYDVCITYNSSNKNIKKIFDKVKEFKQNIFAIEADFTQPHISEYIFDEYNKQWKSLDLLINNAGVFSKIPFYQISEKDWDETFSINLKTSFFLSQKFSEIMTENSVIVNISSVGAFEFWKDRLLYNLSKSGLEVLTKQMAKELSPKIRVNSIAPGAIKINSKDNKINELISVSKIPLGRYGTDVDILSALNFIIENSYLTGTTLIIDGGKLLRKEN